MTRVIPPRPAVSGYIRRMARVLLRLLGKGAEKEYERACSHS